MLRYIQRPETDPYYNLAAEEFILKTADQDVFMTWRNEPAVIIGKHQNTSKEINASFVDQHKIPVIRRITGGGTVYHDPGNINFSFIFTQRKENLIDFREFTRPVVLFLQQLGLSAAFEEKNNITAGGFKVSGNSAHLFKSKVLYHGTLLFDANLEMLENTIRGHELRYLDHSVNSVRVKTINIKGLLNNSLTIDQFIDLFRAYIFTYFGGYFEENLTESDQAAIKKLVEEKYRTDAWNFGYSPDYVFNNQWFYQEDEFSVSFEVRKGIIQNIAFTGKDRHNLEMLQDQLHGCFHQKQAVELKLNAIRQQHKFDDNFLNQLAFHLF